ncbi:MAG: Coenzyme F420-0:L-glutamate ligase / coenzyme F420:gamma-L-glutamate ligase [Marmoricola sp.]|nr:Coenzyme F420-0:L-glutamate ligase / coenzyme F420:gamma-L-glutamate ligase [Marmoricola sp.]
MTPERATEGAAAGPAEGGAPVSRTRTGGLRAWAVPGIGEVAPGTDLVRLLDGVDLADGDVVLVTSKVVSKAQGRVRTGEREQAIQDETVRVVARRGPTSIVENRLGLVMAAAGVDASNVAPGEVLLLPEDPDGTAVELRARLRAERGCNVAVVLTDTAGRAWRTGQTDLALGAAGLVPLEDLSGTHDGYGNPLAVTAPAVADELAGLAELVTGKTAGLPVSVVRGWGGVLPPGEHGPGARSLNRPRSQDMFALGAREAVVAAVRGTSADCFGTPAPAAEVVAALAACGLRSHEVGDSVRVDLPEAASLRDRVVALERARLLAHAHAWFPQSDVPPAGGAPGAGDGVTLSPRAP